MLEIVLSYSRHLTCKERIMDEQEFSRDLQRIFGANSAAVIGTRASKGKEYSLGFSRRSGRGEDDCVTSPKNLCRRLPLKWLEMNLKLTDVIIILTAYFNCVLINR